ncbi:heme-binding protein 2-like [Senna tora]|uniref:Heme-binding protein 2-like n=1 Tax=Senna tora TaxID=362788 RepID=A0A834X1W8_9FABA|nr:heme-binding protein 2-like [Senna tora]
MASSSSFFPSLLIFSFLSLSCLATLPIPPTCERIECPTYDVLQSNDAYEIRRYNSSVWASASPVQEISIVEATRKVKLTLEAVMHFNNSFSSILTLSDEQSLLSTVVYLFDYIQGKNKYNEKIEMTGPVITEISPGDGPLCESTFEVSFFVPKKIWGNPPPAKGIHVQRWKPVYVAARRFSGFVSDSNVGEEAAALEASIADTEWADAIEKSHGGGHASVFTVAQYNSPFEFDNRVNEIWFLFDLDSGMPAMPM